MVKCFKLHWGPAGLSSQLVERKRTKNG